MIFSMSVEDHNKEAIYGIRITTENFEEVFVDETYIECIHVEISEFGGRK